MVAPAAPAPSKELESAKRTSLALLATTLVLAGVVASGYAACSGSSDSGSSGGSSGSSWASNGISESSSGTLFRAVRVRRYTGERAFAKWAPPIGKEARTVPQMRPRSGPMCKNWAVTTTIFPPTKTVKQIAELRDWCASRVS